MSATNRNILKGYFLTGKYPTQAQFENLIDSMFNLNEDTLDIVKIDGLQEALDNIQAPEQSTSRELRVEKYVNVNSNQVFLLPAKAVIRGINITFLSGTPVVRAGTTDGGKEIMSDRDIISGKDSNNQVLLSVQTNTNIFISISSGSVNLNIDYETNYF